MSHAVLQAGKVRQLDRRVEPDEQLTEEDLEPARLTRRLMAILRDIARLLRMWRPQVIDHWDVEVDGTGTTVYRLPHGFDGRVNWWVIDATAGAQVGIEKDPSSDDNTLCLISTVAGTVSVRIEEAG